MNLRSIPVMQAAFGVPVGLSDHTNGTHAAVAAVALGACIVEKHFTLDRTMRGPDHPFAAEPAGAARPRRPHPRHRGGARRRRQARPVAGGVGGDVRQGAPFGGRRHRHPRRARSITADMLTVKRPGHGVKPKFIELLVGRVARTDIEEDDVVTWDMV